MQNLTKEINLFGTKGSILNFQCLPAICSNSGIVLLNLLVGFLDYRELIAIQVVP